ncbi:MAG: porin family protein [Parabacteroides sp.]|nr:porin family protein [Parabacteroides sp.]
MRDDKDHNERLDDFSGYMRQRLEEHRLPVDADGWNEVEARMNRKARSRGWLWTGGLVAAAVLALAIWLLPSPEKMPLEESRPFQEEISEKAEEMNLLLRPPAVPIEPVKKRIAKAWKPETREDEVPEAIEVVGRDTVAAVVEEPSVEVSGDSTVVVVKRGDSTVPLPDGERSTQRKASLRKNVKKNKRNKWLLAAAVGSSGYVDRFLNTDLNYEASSPGDMDDPTQGSDSNKPDKDEDEKEDGNGNGNTSSQTALFRNASVLRGSRMDENFLDNRSFESYPDVSYSLPISFGFTVRKDLSRRIAVESGLMYTYLSTTFKKGGDSPSEVRSSLHYLGIPVNLVVYVWKNQRWNVYLSGGFMMEKGLQAVYSGYLSGNGTTISQSKKEGIHGMQWSVNASVGAAYRFYGDWSLYFEPRFSHYFDCDQPASIRTDKPLGFGLNAGIRYSF